MSLFGGLSDAFSWIGNSVGSLFESVPSSMDTSYDAWDFGGLGEAVTGSPRSGDVGLSSGLSGFGGLLSKAAGAAGSAFGGGSGTQSRSSVAAYKAEYPTAQGQKAGDAGTPRGLRAVDPDAIARYWFNKMNTLNEKGT